MARSNLPMSLPGGELMPFMSARRRTEMFDLLFEGSGGFERALAWVEKSDANYETFLKLYAKGQAKTNQVEHGVTTGLEDLLREADELDKATVIEGTCTEVT